MSDTEIDELLSMVRRRYDELKTDRIRNDFTTHLRSLARYHNEPMDYPDLTAAFPDRIHIAFAVCHPECGAAEFIVDGNTQKCQYCGGTMFRLEVHEYSIMNEKPSDGATKKKRSRIKSQRS